MSDSRYAPPALEAETLLTPLEREIMRWEKIYALTAIPINTLPVTLPIIAILSPVFRGFEFVATPITIITILASLTLLGSWFYAGRSLSKLKQQKFKHSKNWEIPQ